MSLRGPTELCSNRASLRDLLFLLTRKKKMNRVTWKENMRKTLRKSSSEKEGKRTLLVS
ncbi:hypothetical protein CSUI_007015, partial [Cystoisospora suis]